MNLKPPGFRSNIWLIKMVADEEEHIRRDPGAHLAEGRFAIFWIVGDYGPLNRHDVPRLIHCFKGSIQQGLHGIESEQSGDFDSEYKKVFLVHKFRLGVC